MGPKNGFPARFTIKVTLFWRNFFSSNFLKNQFFGVFLKMSYFVSLTKIPNSKRTVFCRTMGPKKKRITHLIYKNCVVQCSVQCEVQRSTMQCTVQPVGMINEDEAYMVCLRKNRSIFNSTRTYCATQNFFFSHIVLG